MNLFGKLPGLFLADFWLAEMRITTVIASRYEPLLKGLRTLLEGEGDIEVLATAHGPVSVLQLLRDLAPNILVLDAGLPNGSSIQTIRTTLKLFPTVNVLALGMDSSHISADRILEAGALGYLPKDRLAEELVTAVWTVAAGGTYVSSTVK